MCRHTQFFHALRDWFGTVRSEPSVCRYGADQPDGGGGDYGNDGDGTLTSGGDCGAGALPGANAEAGGDGGDVDGYSGGAGGQPGGMDDLSADGGGLSFGKLVNETQIRDAKPLSLAAEHPQIVDGDTFRTGGERVRLIGLDAPDSDGNGVVLKIAAQTYLEELVKQNGPMDCSSHPGGLEKPRLFGWDLIPSSP